MYIVEKLVRREEIKMIELEREYYKEEMWERRREPKRERECERDWTNDK